MPLLAGRGLRLRANAGPRALEEAVGGAKTYLQTPGETFSVAVAEAVAAGCIPVVPDHTAHTRPFPLPSCGTAPRGRPPRS